VFCVTIPREITRRLGINKGDHVFVEIKLKDVLLFQGVKKVTLIGKMLSIVLPKGRAFEKIWRMLYVNGSRLDITLINVDEVMSNITSSS